MLAKHSEGVIAASACLGGVYAGCMWRNAVYDDEGNRTRFDEVGILADMRETTRQMQEIFGDRWYGELQWNNIPEQHLLNQYIIKMSEEFGMKLISTADSHYPNPDAWKDRILYKKLGWLGRKDEVPSELPAGLDEVGYELYPKNGDQMWESIFRDYSEECHVDYR